jgi:hypothetical protein
MESKNLTAIASELRKQHNLVHERASILRTELGVLEEEAARLNAALAALSGSTPKAVSNALKAKAPRRTTQTPSAKKSDVISAMRRVLEREDVMEAGELKKQVETLVTEAGFNRFGFAMRWNEACHDPQFTETAGCFRLANEIMTDKPSTLPRSA